MSLRTPVLALLVAGFAWFTLAQNVSGTNIARRAVDLLDGREGRSILIIGNSRTYENDMPAMLREIADSASSPTKFKIETSAFPAATFKTHWENARTRNLLKETWDDIILQAESGAQASRHANNEFLFYGAKLGAAAKLNHGRPYLLVGWAYDPKLYDDRDYIAEGFRRSDHLRIIRAMHAQLASDAKLSMINVAGPWEAIRLSDPSIRLTSDGNHPTVAGTYLYALAVYARLSNGPVDGVTYVPDGVAPEDAKKLRDAVDSSSLP